MDAVTAPTKLYVQAVNLTTLLLPEFVFLNWPTYIIFLNFLIIKFLFPPGHPRFMNQLSCGLDVISMAGEWLIATANTNMFTYEIAPVFILMETVVLEKMRQIIGWQGGDSILAPGLFDCAFYI